SCCLLSSHHRKKDEAILALKERQQVGVDGVGLRGGHAVREVFVGFQSSVLQQLCGERAGGGVGDDLVVFAVHDQDRDGVLLQVFGEIGLRKSHDAIVVGLGASHHSLTPPVLDCRLDGLHGRAVESVKRAGGEVAIEFRTVGG